MTWEWLQTNWESLYAIYGVGILGLVGLIVIFKKYRNLQKRYQDLIENLYERAYDITLRVLEEKLKLEVSERVHARESWEKIVAEYISELKKRKGS